MTLAIRWGEDDTEKGGFLYFDAVTAYTQNYKGQVTKHPVDGGGNITDHFIRDNPSFTLSAIITGVDISTGSYLVQDLDNQTPLNTKQSPNAVSVHSTDDSLLKRFLPEVIGQFLPEPTPQVVMDDAREDLIEQIRELLISLTHGEAFNEDTLQFEQKIELVRLLEFDKLLIKRITSNLVVTGITFKEDAASGFALYCDISFEQVTFANLRKTTVISGTVGTELSKKAASKSDKGKVSSADSPDSTVREDVDDKIREVFN